MAGQADGSIIIDTELSSEGFKAGSAELLAAIKALSEEVKNLRVSLTELFKKPLTPEVNTSGAEEKVAALEEQVRELQSAMEELRNNGNADVNTSNPPDVNMSGATQKASSLQKQIDAVNSSVERLEPTFRKAMSGSESAMNTFDGKATALENKIVELREQLEAVAQTQYPTQPYEEITQQVTKAEQALFRLYDKQDKMQATGVQENSRQWQSLQYDIRVAEEALARFERSQAAMQANGTAFTMGVDTSQYAQMEATLSSAQMRLAQMRSETSQTDSFMRRLASGARSVALHIGNAAKSAAGALVRGIKSAASHMANLLKTSKHTKNQFSGLISGAKKFALSLLGARGVYMLLRKAVSAYMAENQQLANQLSACWSGIGNILGPIITKLINLVAQAVAYVTAFLKLFGVFGTSAKKAISGAGGAAEKASEDLKRQLASFDELNVLSDNSSDGGGGGGAGDTSAELPDVTLPDWAKLMVEQLKAGDWAAAATTLADQLNNMIASVDWAGIGQKIGYYLNGALTFLATFIREFDWQALGSDLATMLNNIITSVDWGNLGELLVAKWSILLKFLTGFFETFDGKAFGDGLYDLIMGAINACDWVGLTGQLFENLSNVIQSIDFGKIAEALSTGIRTLLQSLNAAITNFDWAGLGGQVADFLNNIDWSGMFSDLVSLLGNGLIGALNLLNGFVSEVDWNKLGDEIWSCLESLVTDIDWDTFGASLGQFVSNAITGVFTLIGSLFSDHDWGALIQDLSGSLGTAIGEAIANIDWMGVLASLTTAIVSLVAQIPSIIVGALGGIADLLAGIFEGIGLDGVAGFFKGIGDAMRTAGTWLKENLVDPVVNWVKNLFGIASPSTVFAEIGDWLIQGLFQGISNAWSAITEFFSNALSGIVNTISTAWDGIKSFTSTAWNGIKTGLSTVWNGIKNTATTTWSNLKTTVSTGWDKIKSTTSSTWKNVKSSLSSVWSGVKSTASSTWSGLKDTVSSGWEKVKSNTTTTWNTVKSSLSSSWNSIKSTASSTWNNLKSNIASSWSNIKSNSSSTLNSIKSTASSAWSSMKSTASSSWSGIKSSVSSAANTLKSNLSSTWSNIKSTTSSTWSSIKSTITNQGWSGVGSNICSGIRSGISNGWAALKSYVSSVASSLLSAAKSALGIRSPSRLFRNEVGYMVGAGWAEGVNDSEKGVLASVSGIADAIAEEAENATSTISLVGDDSVAYNALDGSLSTFADRVENSFSNLMNRLQAIANSVTFQMPNAAMGMIVPYKVVANAETDTVSVTETIGAANEELGSIIIQALTNTTVAVVDAIQQYSGTTVNIDKDSLTSAVINEINRRTRASGQSPLLV